jgi:hypothetical protein
VRAAALCLLACIAAAACASHPEAPDNALVCRAFAAQASRQEVLARGKIVALLGTQEGPSGNHEGFLLKLDGDCDLLLRVETNVDLTGPVPLERGETVEVKGEYEFEPLGGVVHWTHHDPAGRHIDGYVLAAGKLYQ